MKARSSAMEGCTSRPALIWGGGEQPQGRILLVGAAGRGEALNEAGASPLR